MTQVIRICKYGCNTQLGQFDTKQNKYLESDGTLHTRERCESLKQKQDPDCHNGNDISVEVLLKKLESVGIKVDLDRLRNMKMKRSYWKNHCKGCGEWLQGFDMCPECGRINK